MDFGVDSQQQIQLRKYVPICKGFELFTTSMKGSTLQLLETRQSGKFLCPTHLSKTKRLWGLTILSISSIKSRKSLQFKITGMMQLQRKIIHLHIGLDHISCVQMRALPSFKKDRPHHLNSWNYFRLFFSDSSKVLWKVSGLNQFLSPFFSAFLPFPKLTNVVTFGQRSSVPRTPLNTSFSSHQDDHNNASE